MPGGEVTGEKETFGEAFLLLPSWTASPSPVSYLPAPCSCRRSPSQRIHTSLSESGPARSAVRPELRPREGEAVELDSLQIK